MKFIVVNNKALFNNAKIQRAQWLDKRNHSSDKFEPDIS